MSINRFLFVCVAALSLAGCQSEYERYVDRELERGITNDSLIFGMHMGQTRRDFFAICWELNRQKLISQGTGNANARYVTARDTAGNETPESKEMLFYGIFDDDDVMRGMRMTYSYIAWAPWNEERQAAQLLLDLRDEYLQAYPGNDFIEIELAEAAAPALVKIDGNRQILMYPKNDKDVAVKIEDLHFKLNEQWKKD